MKKVLILCRRDSREDYDTQRSMLRGMAGAKNAEYSGADYEDLIFKYDGNELRITDSVSGVDVADHDAIFFIGWFKTKPLDDTARAVAHYAKAKGVAFANSEAFLGRSFTKLSQCVLAALSGVTVTPFLFTLDQELLLKEVEKESLTTPYIAKAISASRGRDNYLITDYEQLVAAVREPADPTAPPRYFILQEFIPNDGDYRILVAGDKVRLVIHRQAQGDSHVNNTSQGGRATLVAVADLPPKVLDDSIKMANALHRELTGVDMIMHRETGVYYFLEANNMPQLSTGSFVPEKMAVLDEYLSELAAQ